jgi:hypothetical protein
MLITPDVKPADAFAAMLQRGESELILDGRFTWKGVQVPRHVRSIVPGPNGATICNPADNDLYSRCLLFLKPGATYNLRGIKFDGQWKSGQPGVEQHQQCSIFAQGCNLIIDNCEGWDTPACWIKAWTDSTVHLINSRCYGPAAGALQIGGTRTRAYVTGLHTDGSIWIEGYGATRDLRLSLAHCVIGGQLSAQLWDTCSVQGHDIYFGKVNMVWGETKAWTRLGRIWAKNFYSRAQLVDIDHAKWEGRLVDAKAAA